METLMQPESIFIPLSLSWICIYFTSSMTSSFDFANGKKLLQKTKIYEIPVIVFKYTCTYIQWHNIYVLQSLTSVLKQSKNLMVFKNYFNVNLCTIIWYWQKTKIEFKNRQHKMSIMYRTMFIIGWYAKYLWPLWRFNKWFKIWTYFKLKNGSKNEFQFLNDSVLRTDWSEIPT